MIELHSIAEEIANGCNFNCPHCHSLARFRRGITPLENFVETNTRWAKLIKTKRFNLVGGEPFLNNGIADIAAAALDIWEVPKVSIWTNGSLIPCVNRKILENLARLKVSIYVSIHANYGVHDFAKKQYIGMKTASDFGIPVMFRSNHLTKTWNTDNSETSVLPDFILDTKDTDINRYLCPHCKNTSWYKNRERIYFCYRASAGNGIKNLSPQWERAFTENTYTTPDDPHFETFFSERNKPRWICGDCGWTRGNGVIFAEKIYSELPDDWTIFLPDSGIWDRVKFTGSSE